MIKFNIETIEYKRKPEAIEKLSNAGLTEDYISFAVRNHYAGGLENQWRRIWARVQRKFDTALETKNYEIEIEMGELDFILAAIKGAKFEADISKFVVVLEDTLEALKNAK